MSAPLDRLTALVAGMTGGPWIVRALTIRTPHYLIAKVTYSADAEAITALTNVADELLTLARAAARVAETPYNAVPNADALRLLKREGENLNAKLAETMTGKDARNEV